MSDFTTLGGTLDSVWSRLEDAVGNPRAPARFLALATVGTGDRAEARMIVLRGAKRHASELTAYTNAASAKTNELNRTPQATLLVWDQNEGFQIRLRVIVSQRTGTADEWRRISETDRGLYGRDPKPGQSLVTPYATAPTPDPAHFTVLTARIEEIETLQLGRDIHRRAVFRRDGGFAGQWIAP